MVAVQFGYFVKIVTRLFSFRSGVKRDLLDF